MANEFSSDYCERLLLGSWDHCCGFGNEDLVPYRILCGMKCHICDKPMEGYRRRDEICDGCRSKIKSPPLFEISDPQRLINQDGISFYVTWASKESEAKLYVKCIASEARTVEIIGKNAEKQLTEHLKSLRDELNGMLL